MTLNKNIWSKWRIMRISRKHRTELLLISDSLWTDCNFYSSNLYRWHFLHIFFFPIFQSCIWFGCPQCPPGVPRYSKNRCRFPWLAPRLAACFIYPLRVTWRRASRLYSTCPQLHCTGHSGQPARPLQNTAQKCLTLSGKKAETISLA